MMRRNIKIFVIYVIAISITSGLSFAQQEPNRPIIFGSRGGCVITNTKGIKPVAHEEILDILKQEEKQDTEELNNRFEQFPKEQKLEAIAYCLKEGEHLGQAVSRIVWDPNLHDRCLVPYLAEAMPKMEKRDLMMAAIAAWRIPDINLMEPLLNYVVDSNYAEPYLEGIPGGPANVRFFTVFEEAAMAISMITNNRIGQIDRTKPKEKLIQEWRSAWPETKQEMQKEIRPVAHNEMLALLAKAEEEGLAYRSEFAEKFKTYKWSEKLETIAYALEQSLYLNAISNYLLYEDKDLRDKRLMPYIDKAIKESKEEKLLTAVRIASVNPDSSLLPSLMKYALENDFVKAFKYGIEENQVEYLSVFGNTSRAIYRITNGQIGSQQYSSTRKEIPEEEKKSQIEKWCKIYDETLKQDYEK